VGETITDVGPSNPAGRERRTSPTEAVASVQELRQYGRTLRSTLARGGHGSLGLPERDPVAIIEAQNATRLPDLVPVRMGRMLQSPFAYYRGTAAVMAHDLAAAAVTGHQVVCCGDAHIANFGLFASPERRVLFDLNDFDEASDAPWEWDVKRFAASVVVGGRDNGLPEPRCRDITEQAVQSYCVALQHMFELTTLERFYFCVDTDWIEQQAADAALVRGAVDKARKRTAEEVLDKMTATTAEGGPRIRDVPPITRHVDHITVDWLADVFDKYRSTLRADTALVLSQFTLVDYVLRVVGVGSVGTRCYLAMFVGPSGDPLFLQIKEAPPSVLESHGGQRCRLEWLPPVEQCRQGYRVVSGQRILQADSDRFLGWVRTQRNERAGYPPTDFYVRQFRDMKGAVATQGLSPSQYQAYVSLCAQLLARAHSQSPGAAAIAGYVGQSDQFARAVTKWSLAYADQTERDYAALEEAVRAGRLPAEHGI
jgi:uncharacterized protein (DUF2252 family)